MCGIAGIFGKEDKELVEKMKKAIKHRGPDAHGTFSDKNVTLGHVRLSIIDLSKAGNQPMSNENEDVWIVFNGEVYNFKELREDLEKKGHKFKSNTDTETIIHGYEEYGFDIVKRLRGMFAFAIYDGREKLLFLARDRVGIKPLYYTIHDRTFYFASEIKALLEIDGLERRVNKKAFYHYLTLINTPAPQTLFEGICKLEAGHYLVIDSNLKPKKRKYWSIDAFRINYDLTKEYLLDDLERMISESVHLRMIADVPYGVFLSGGVDSSTIVAFMHEFVGANINTFSIATGTEEKFNELKYARTVAEKFETNHREILLDEEKVLKFIPTLVYQQDEPIADPVNIPVYYLAKEARKQKVIVLQVGEGADELFCGYPVYKYEVMLRERARLASIFPGWIRAQLLNMVSKLTGRELSLLRDLLMNDAGRNTPMRNVLGFGEGEKREYLGAGMKASVKSTTNLFEKWTQKTKKINAHAKWRDLYLQKTRVIEFKNRLPELLLMRVDKFTMASPIEARVPFLDHVLVEKAMQVPAWQVHLNNGKETKHLLKIIARKRLPKQIVDRKKIGFGVPISHHLRNELKDLAVNEFERNELKEFINLEKTRKLMSTLEKGIDTSFKVWTLLNFALWYKRFILNEKIRI